MSRKVDLTLLPERARMLEWLVDLHSRIEAGTVVGFGYVVLNSDGSISNASAVQPGGNEMTLLGGIELLRSRLVADIVNGADE